MRPELRKKLTDNRERLVSELDVTTSFLASLSSRGVITEEHKAQIKVKGTPHEKVDKLIDILGRRPDAAFEVFCKLVKNENSDLFHLLNGLEEPQKASVATTRRKKDETPLKPTHPVGKSKILSSNPPTVISKPTTFPEVTESQQPERKQRYHADREDYPTKLAKQTGADIDKYLEGFEKVRDKLEVYIDPLNELPSCFVRHGIMTRDEADKIDCTKSHAARQIVAKMRECLNNNHLKILHIVDALVDNDQEHIANFIKSSGENTDSPDRVLNEEELGAIDRNMFCVKKLVNIGNDFLDLLVEKKCITAIHKEWIMNFRKENKDVVELFEILKRRSLTHFTVFNSCLEETGQKRIVDILKTGGVIEITNHLLGIGNPVYLESIEREILDQFRDYVEGTNETNLNEEQKLSLDKFLNKDKKRIKFVGCSRTNSFALYFQCETDVSHEWLIEFFAQKMEWTNLYQILQPRFKMFSNFDVDVGITNSSRKPSIISGVTAKFFTDSTDGSVHNIWSEDKPLVIVEFSKLFVGDMIGAGGYGEVYKAKHPNFPGNLAYKKIRAIFIQKRDEIELKNEAKIHMRCDHPNIVKCFAVVFEPNNYGMILEFMKHGEATNFLIENNSLRSKLKIIKDVAAGMKYLHNIKPYPVIHGDLKSENVLIGEDEIAKVCDFGFSRWKEYSKFHSTQAVPLGTVTHVPPERWRDCNLRKNEMFDVYSFGITMWEILTLKSPFLGGLSAQIPIWVENGQRPDLRDVPVEVAENVVDLMVQCWDGDKLKRPSFDFILPKLEKELGTL